MEQGVVNELGQAALSVFTDAIRSCLSADMPAVNDSLTDAVTVWVFLHGYAHQRLVGRAFPRPPGNTEHVPDNVTGQTQVT